MPGGLRNPLGLPAPCISGRTTRTRSNRIHGTVEPWTIGQSVSSGCIRMINQDVIDLYQRHARSAPRVVVLAARS